jgi:hypothetical protein
MDDLLDGVDPREREDGHEVIPDGWIVGPRFKPSRHYLSNPVWCGKTGPKTYMGFPWGLGGECWYVTVYGGNPDDPENYERRRMFAAVDRDVALAAGRQWAADGFPAGKPGYQERSGGHE